MVLVIGLWTFLRACLWGSVAVALENVALRHQLAVLHRSGRRPKLRRWVAFITDTAASPDRRFLLISSPAGRLEDRSVLTIPFLPSQEPPPCRPARAHVARMLVAPVSS